MGEPALDEPVMEEPALAPVWCRRSWCSFTKFFLFICLRKSLSSILSMSNKYVIAIKTSSTYAKKIKIFHFWKPVFKTIVQQPSINKSISILLFLQHFIILLILKQNQNGVNNRLETREINCIIFTPW